MPFVLNGKWQPFLTTSEDTIKKFVKLVGDLPTKSRSKDDESLLKFNPIE